MKSTIQRATGVAHHIRMLIPTKSLRQPQVLISCALVVGQQLTGVNAFLGYAATLFKHCGIEDPIKFNSIFNSVWVMTQL